MCFLIVITSVRKKDSLASAEGGVVEMSDFQTSGFYPKVSIQVIPDHGNRQKRGALFTRYLLKRERVTYQNFYQVFEISF